MRNQIWLLHYKVRHALKGKVNSKRSIKRYSCTTHGARNIETVGTFRREMLVTQLRQVYLLPPADVKGHLFHHDIPRLVPPHRITS